MTKPVDFVFVVRQRNNPPYNETLRTNSSDSVGKWITSRLENEPKSKNPNRDFPLTINGRRYDWPRNWASITVHIEKCLELDAAFYNED